jgi:undecaprenyl-diphosphatase
VSVLEAVTLGIVQGLTEFLPVSSSGHLVLGQALLGLEMRGVAFEVVVHRATLCAVLWVYRRRIAGLARGAVTGARDEWTYIGLLALATIPAAVAGTAGKSFFEGAFGRPVWAAGLLLVTGALVWSVRFTAPTARDPRPGAAQALWIGVSQALAILPGISRSGATVAVGSWRGVEAVRLAEFSFLLSVPAILGAGLLEVSEIRAAAGESPAALTAAFAGALLAGVAAIRFFVRMLEGRTFHRFAYYCWLAGGAYLVAAILVPGLR